MNIKATAPATPIASASVLLLRDAPQGLQVLLTRRHQRSGVLGGAYVFPGGKVDAEDATLADRLDQPGTHLSESLGEPLLTAVEAAALYVAAIREVFEEAGILFASVDADGGFSPGKPRRLEDVLHSSGHAFLASSLLAPWSRWITPIGSVMLSKRFDARFFVAALPAGQDASHDEHETTECIWLEPRAALEQYWDNQMQLAPPQIMSLAHLARYSSGESVLAEARGRKPPRVQPEISLADDVRILTLPGDARHSDRALAMPGPTRLVWRNERWEPEGGIEALLR